MTSKFLCRFVINLSRTKMSWDLYNSNNFISSSNVLIINFSWFQDKEHQGISMVTLATWLCVIKWLLKTRGYLYTETSILTQFVTTLYTGRNSITANDNYASLIVWDALFFLQLAVQFQFVLIIIILVFVTWDRGWWK